MSQIDGDWPFHYVADLPKGTLSGYEDITEAVGLGPNGAAGTLKGDRLTIADFTGWFAVALMVTFVPSQASIAPPASSLSPSPV